MQSCSFGQSLPVLPHASKELRFVAGTVLHAARQAACVLASMQSKNST